MSIELELVSVCEDKVVGHLGILRFNAPFDYGVDLPPKKESSYNVSLGNYVLAPICLPTIVRILQVFNL